MIPARPCAHADAEKAPRPHNPGRDKGQVLWAVGDSDHPLLVVVVVELKYFKNTYTLDWLVSRSQGSSRLHLSQTEITSMCSHAWLCMWKMGIEAKSCAYRASDRAIRPAVLGNAFICDILHTLEKPTSLCCRI